MELMKEELGKVWQYHYLLRWMNPEDKLLRYFIVDENGKFRRNPDLTVKKEFLYTFGDNAQKDDFFKKTEVPSVKILDQREFLSFCFQNYCDVVEEKIIRYYHAKNN